MVDPSLQNAKQFAQKKDGWCGSAALAFALSKVGIDVTQEQMVKDTGTTKDGCDPKDMIQAVKKHGGTVDIISGKEPKTTLSQLDEAVKEKKSVIVDYLVSGEKEGGHYVVFLGKSGNNVKIWNPSGGKYDMLDKSYFIENWRDRTEEGKLMKNWAMVIGA